jgi:nicotinate-nucleotide adenylyltransferase
MAKPHPKNALLKHAARWRGRTVGLYGGSFNPAHEGHLHVAKEALKQLGLDAIWLMVSPGNPLKDQAEMAKQKRRYKSLKTVLGSHPKLFVTDIEKDIGTHYTADTLSQLTKSMPRTRFIWIMGADNLANFHYWGRWKTIVNTVPIAIFDRPGYSTHVLNSRFTRCYARFRVPMFRLKHSKAPAWTFVTMPRHSGSATIIRHQKGIKWWR